ncbi:MAG: SAVED domain-containing protein [Nitrospirota bacterium]|nr:SAVED domain-containing protein [candidate division NC10 bacterium]MEC4681499.1 SAVED domain-containing protein [Nitrospirota bacterium]
MSPPIYFLSYSRQNLNDIKTIARTLMIHGIEVWQDISNLGTGLAESKIREAISVGSDGLLLFITPQSLKSDFIRSVELPEAEKKYKNDSNFQIVPVFGVPIDDASAALKGCLTIPISNFNGAKIGGQGERQDVLTAAQRAAEIILEGLRIQQIDPLCIGLSSKQKTPADVALHLDFTSYFENGLPPDEVWTEQFVSALARVKGALVRRNRLSLRLYAFCHLSLGCLFGYIFRKTTGYKLELEQITNGKPTIWATDAKREANPLRVVELPGVLESRDLCVKINLMSADDTSVARHAEKNNMSYRAVLELSPAHYPCTITGSEAIAIATDLADKVKECHARYDTNTVHLFAAIPLGLSVLIGYNLNACGTIQCYEFDNARREYFPSCTLI